MHVPNTRRRARHLRVLLILLALVVTSLTATWATPSPAAAAPCDTPIVSAVACENTLPGTPESTWGITGAGSANIQGFATDISVDQGGTVGFKINTNASSYRLDIYRMGFYGGDGARKITTVLPTVFNNQPSCLTQASSGLVDCGNWTQNASWQVPIDAVSGIYFAHAVRTDATAGESHIVFVVRDDDGGSDLLFQTSDTTWQAYNSYGGNSLYTGSPAGRAYKVSYNRPFNTRNASAEDWVFNAEYPMVRFLESNGYDVSYTTGLDSHRRGNELTEHETFLSVGHDEYWSGTQRTNVELARAAGVNLAFFSGNEVFWKTRWENSIDASNTPNRTLVSYKETHANAVIDPAAPTWTGTWRDPRFSPPGDGGRPENALTGTIFTMNCCAIDMVVKAADGDLRFWRNTRVADLTGNQTTTVGTNVIGYEWDEDLDNGHRPAGAFRVSETAGSGDRILDHGSTYSPGQATHAMTMYRHASGALVFGAGTINWSWGLDGQHDEGSAPPDVAAQQATVNVLADMGAQATTLRPGLVPAVASTDVTAPTSAITSPAPGATVAVGSPVTVAGTAADIGGGRVGGVEVSTDNGTTWRRATGREAWAYTFTPTTTGSLTLRTRATDDSANTQAPGAGFTINVADPPASCPCSIWPGTATPDRTDPDKDAVELGVKFRASSDGFVTGIRYYKPVETSGVHVGSLWSSTGTRLANVTFTNESASGWQQAAFTTPVPVTAGTTYVASYFTPTRYAASSNYFATATTRGPLTALANGTEGGNGVYRYTSTAGAFPNSTFNSENYWVDVVYSDTDTIKPTLSARTPSPGATSVSVGADATATFSEPVQQPTIAFQLTAPGGGVVPATTTYDAGSRTATLDPNTALAPTTTYTARMSGARDTAGNTMDPVTWTFTTETPDTTKPTVSARTPAPGATGVAVNSVATVTFSEPVQQATIAFELRTASDTLVPANLTYSASTRTATLTPTTALATGATYTARLSGARDASGNLMDPIAWTFTTTSNNLGCPCTIWPGTATPQRTDADTNAVELGVKFRATSNGFITGIRYYRPAVSTGTHVGSLWTAGGTRLGQVTFTGGTASGWQQATFPSPIAITAGTTYVASYFTPSRYVVDSAYFATGPVTRGPLTALANSEGGNGVYRYTGTAGTFPDQTYQGENYWVDVVFAETSDDTIAPTVTTRLPAPGSSGLASTTRPSATFSEGVVAGSISMVLRTSVTNQVVASTTAYDPNTLTATLTPNAPLASSTQFTVTLSGARDSSGNTMAPVSWSFETGTPPPPLDVGPGGPIAIVTSDANKSSTYLLEIARAEGLNEFANLKNTDLSLATLSPYAVVILGNVTITDAQVIALTTWVLAGGNLVLMRPDSRLLSLAGLTTQTGTVANGYLRVNPTVEPGAGITAETMQFHGTASRYGLTGGAVSVAELFTTATAGTGQPAVAWRTVGISGGQVATFAFDLAQSVIWTRQGNPAWAGTERDGQSPIRANDLFFGGGSTDWVNLNKAHIPQADEQQRLLANLVTVMTRDKLPMPRFWYFPARHKAVIVATGDDHARGGTAGRMSTYSASSPAGCSVTRWECLRFTAYVYPNAPLTDSEAAVFTSNGFEIGLHPDNGCNNYPSLASLQSTYGTQLEAWRSRYQSIPSPSTGRFHCMVWSDWASQPKAEAASGIRLDTNYYYWPGSWIANRPGLLTGSGLPMRFTDTDGTMLDVYQAPTQMTDESGQSYPFTPNTLLDRALGAEAYYGAFTANLHADNQTTFEDTQVLASAQSRGVPVVSSKQLLTWLDGRNASSFSGLSWSGSALAFTLNVGSGANQLTAMLPTSGPGGRTLVSISRGATAVPFTLMTVKGQQYATFAAAAGAHTATYAVGGGGGGGIAQARVTEISSDSATLTWSTDEPSSSEVLIGTSPGSLKTVARVAERTGEHMITLDSLSSGRVFYRVRSVALDGTVETWPALDRPPATFATRALDRTAPRIRGVGVTTLPDGTARVTWRTDEPATSRVRLGSGDVRLDDELVRSHAVVLTGLAAGRTFSFRVSSSDADGNVGRIAVRRFRSAGHGIAIQTIESFRPGTWTPGLVLDDTGFGSLTMAGRGSASYTSEVLDSGEKVDWRRTFLRGAVPPGTSATVQVRTGATRLPNASWSSWTDPLTHGDALQRSGRYLQFRVLLTSSASAVPEVTGVGFTHSGVRRHVGEVR